MLCRFCGEVLPTELSFEGIHHDCLIRENAGEKPLHELSAQERNNRIFKKDKNNNKNKSASSTKATISDPNLKYQSIATLAIKIFIWVSIISLVLSFLLFIISLDNSSGFLGFIYFLTSIFLILGIYISAQIFFYLKGIYEELKKMNDKQKK